MKSNLYFLNRSGSPSWLKSLSLVIALTVGAILNSAVAQRISSSGGTYTIDNTGTNTGTNFTSFTDAINDLNTAGSFTGNVTINVTAGQTFTENAPVITATGNSGASITFIKSGGGANPKITSSGTTSFNGDAAIVINGGDYFTFNGIDITASDSSLEFGYLIRKSSFNNAARFNTITNSTILMSRLKSYSYAILQSNDSIISASNTAFNTANNALAQTNNNNTYTYITVGNAFNGIWLKGISTAYRDSNNTADYNFIGRTGFANDFGALSGTAGCYGIYANNQFTYQANNNTVKNGVSTSYIYGIYTDGSVNVKHNNNDFSALDILTNTYYYVYCIYLSNSTTGEILNNNFHDIVAIGTSNNYVYGVYTSTTNTIRIANNSMNNITSNVVYGFYSGTGTNCRLTTNNITNVNTVNGGTAYLYYVTGGTTDTVDNNTATNCTSTGSLYAVYTSSATSYRVYNNTIQNMTAGTSNSGGVFGLYTSTLNNANYFNNTISNLKSMAGASTSYGMYFTSITGTCNIYNNKVTDFGNTVNAFSGTGSIYGAYFSHPSSGTVTCNFNNNLINGLVKTYTGAATGTRYLHGLYFSSTGNATATYNIIHNTVSIDGTNAITGSSQVVYTAPTAATSSIMTWRNNIFVNNTPAQTGSAKHYLIWANGSGRIGNASSTSNYNDWYLANTTNGYFGSNAGTDIATLAIWVTTSGFTTMEANSIAGDPLFNSSTNARLLFGSPCAYTGSFISTYTNDILGAVRNTSTPSRGAYETPLDETKPVITYTPALNVYSTSNYSLTNFATITDGVAGFIPNTAGFAPRLYYKTSTNANAFVGNTSADNGWKYVEASNSSSPFSFTIDYSLLLGGVVNVNDVIQYFVVASDTASIANVTANPSTGFVGTGVGSITSAPTNPNSYTIYGTPALYSGATVAQSKTSKVAKGSNDNQILSVKVTTAATGSPAYISQLDFTTLGGGNDSANIAGAKVYYTGSSSTFSTNTLFGTTTFAPTVTGSIGAFSVTGNALCTNGDNYFWLVYNMRTNAVIGDSVDAELTSVTYDGTPNAYLGGATAGNRVIRADFCVSGSTSPIQYEDIGNVTLVANGSTILNNGIATPVLSNFAAINGYTDFTNSIAPVNIATNQLVNASIAVVSSNSFTYDCQAAIYIDYNQDGDFADAGELAWNSTVSKIATNGPFTASFTTPCTAAIGETRMRVIVYESTTPLNATNSCITYYAGETEDYSINIVANPVYYVNSSAIQNTSIIAPNTLNAQILRIPLRAAGCGVGTVTDMYFSTTGSTGAATDITSAKLYATGNTNTFNTNKLLATVSSPNGAFSFTGLADTLLTSTTDTNNYWLAFDIAPGAVLGNTIDATIDSINLIGANVIPTVTNPAGSRLVVSPMTYISSTTVQASLSSIERGLANSKVLGFQVVTSPTGSPIDLTSLDINTNGTDSLPDIANIKVWYTGTSSTFATTLQFGSTLVAPSTTNTITGTMPLANGTNYFWVTYDIASGASVGHNIDGEITSAIIGNAVQTPIVSAPAGTRKVRIAYCASNATTPATYEDIGNVTLITNGDTVLNNGIGTPILSNTSAINGYTNFTNTVAAANIAINQTVSAKIGLIVNGLYTYNNQAAIYIDYNQDGDFLDAGEMVWNSVTNITATAGPFAATFTPPCTAFIGETRMRVALWGGFTTTALTSSNSCGTYTYGETEDYLINILDNPVAYVSSSAIQNTAIIAPNATNAQILRIPLKAKGCGVGVITDMYFNTGSTTNAVTDIVAAKLYSTGKNSSFSTGKLLATVASPNGAFSFTGLLDTVFTATNDTNNYWLAYDVAPGAGLGNVLDAQIDSINIIGSYVIPTNNNPSGSRQIVAPMTYISSTTTQTYTSKVAKGDANNPIIGLEIVTSAIGSAIDLTSLDIATTGTDSLADITNLKVWYTGTSNTFATTTQFGSTIATPSATNTVTGLLSLTNGTNYFWVTYDVISGASSGHAVDAEINSITVAATPEVPTLTAPAGNRLIRAPYCTPTYTTGKTDGDLISNIVIAGTTFSNNTGTSPVNPYYTFFTGAPNLTATLVQGGTYNVTVSIGSFTNQGIAAWVDYDDDGVFSPSEKIGNTTVAINTAFGSATFPITLTCASVPGQRRMRVRGVYANAGPTIDPCNNYGYGEAEDYIITIANNPVAYGTSKAIQNTGIVAPGTNNAKLLRIPLTATGCGIQSISEMRFSTTGTTATTDITSAKLFATGNSAVFNTNKLLGTVLSPSGQFSFAGGFDTLLVALNDTNNYWLVYDIASSATEHNFVDAQVDSIGIVGTYVIPSNNNPAGNLEIITPMTYVGSTVTAPVLSKVGKGETNNTIVRYEVTTSATGAPVEVSALDIATTGTSLLTDITNLKVYYTGTNASFSTSTQFGATVTTPSATQTVTGSQALANGTNYFWVTYDIAAGATISNFVDAEVTSATINGIVQVPAVTAPAGARQIRNAYCASNATSPAIYEDIGNVTLVTAGATVLNNGNATPSLSNPTAINGYTNFTTSVAKAQLYQNQMVNLSIGIINIDAFSYNDMAAIYIDYNQDGDFSDANEMAWTAPTYLNANTGPFTGSFLVPASALLGETRMRVVLTYTTTPLVQANACGTYTYGETEDYLVDIIPLPTPSAYVWNKTGSANFNTPANWTPARTTPLGNDMLFVDGGGSVTMTGVSVHNAKSFNVFNNTTLTLLGTGNFLTSDSLHIEAGSRINAAAGITMVVGADTNTIGLLTGTGKISGTIKRWMNAATSNYNFPIVVNNDSRNININYTVPAATSGSITLSYATGAPGGGGLPTTDASLSLSLVNISDAGVWNITNTDGLVGGTYELVCNADGIANAPVVDQTAIVYRTDAFGSWTAVGSATVTTGTSSALLLNRSGLTAYGQYGIAGTLSNALPVSLTSFTALAKAKDANLTWTTAAEINNKGFEVERSVDGKSFTTVAFVKGAGNSNVKLNYALTDANAFANSNILYYRLKQVDFNGKSTYSQIVKVSVNTENVNVVSAYPNPFTTDYSVSLTSAKSGEATIVMVDMQGRKVANFTSLINAGTNTIPVNNMATLNAGVYFISVTVAGETQTIKLVKN